MAFLDEGLSLNPDGVAVDDGERVWGYEHLSRESEGTSRRLRTLGIGPGTVVGLIGRLDAHLLAALHGIWEIGGAVAPLNERWTPDETCRALEFLSPRLLLVGRGSERALGASAPCPGFGIPGLGVDEARGFPDLQEVPTSPGPLPDIDSGEIAVHLLTSGTSGRPRRVGLTFKNLQASAIASKELLGLVPTDRWLGSLSISHVGGIALVSRAAWTGCTLVLRGPFELAGFLGLLEGDSVTHASLVPTMLFQVVGAWGQRPLPASLRCLLIGGAPATKDLIQAALDLGFPTALTYGLTEAGSQVATATPDLVGNKPGTVGAPVPGVAVELTEEGEILVKGPTVAPDSLREDGWLHTGDLARKDPDGHLWILGRKSERIISGGVNVDPAEVEGILEAYPHIREAVVVGVPDPEWGERVVAVITSRSGESPSLPELGDRLRSTLSPARRPKEIRILSEVPLNSNGKVDRERVRALFR